VFGVSGLFWLYPACLSDRWQAGFYKLRDLGRAAMATYRVLARKCRPQTFADVIGQEHVIRTLTNAIKLGRIAQAYLFAGERGVGKTSVARILAKAFNCHGGLSDQPCGQCASCTEIAAGTSLDVHEIDGASNTGVDDIRVLRENVKYLPARDRYKVYIIDEVHMLSTSAFNALLKTLEEPPPHIIFIFATTESHKIPDTIISRCLRFDFKRISIRAIAEHLGRTARSESVQISQRGLALIAREAEGSMRDAQTIFERALSYCGSSIQDAALEEMLGHASRALLQRICQALLAGDAQGCIQGLQEVYAAGIDLKRFYYNFLEYLRDVIMLKTVSDSRQLVEAADDELDLMRDMVAQVSPDHLHRCFRLWFAAEPEIVRSAAPRIALEVGLLEMVNIQRLVPLEDVLNNLEALRKLCADSPEAVRQPGTAPRESARQAPRRAGPAQPASGDAQALLAFIRSRHLPTASILEHGSLDVQADGLVRIEMPAGSFYIDKLKEPETEVRLRELCRAFFSKDMQVIVQPTEKKMRAEQPADARQEQQRQAVHNPVVQKILETFDGTIVTVRTEP